MSDTLSAADSSSSFIRLSRASRPEMSSSTMRTGAVGGATRTDGAGGATRIDCAGEIAGAKIRPNVQRSGPRNRCGRIEPLDWWGAPTIGGCGCHVNRIRASARRVVGAECVSELVHVVGLALPPAVGESLIQG